MGDLVFIICFGLFLALSLAILPDVGVFIFEMIAAFVYGTFEVIEGIIDLFTTSKEERVARENAAREKEEEWYDYKIGHNSHRL